jgi:hypothetical protein
MYHDMLTLHTETHRDGTVWIYPAYNSKTGKLYWQFIRDDIVTDIIRDVDTKTVRKIMTDERMKISTGRNKTLLTRRQREFTDRRISVSWIGDIPEGMNTTEARRNPAGIIPVCFANNRDSGETRGHSDYERIISDLKDYHDIDLNQSRQLAEFRIKQVQTYDNLEAWKAANGLTSLADLKVYDVDLVMNSKDEKTEYVFPTGAYQAYEAALKRKFRKIVEESGIPEIAWGVKTEGNHASAEEQMGVLVQYVQGKREQITREYKQLFEACLRLANVAEGVPFDYVTVNWNALDALSEKTKADVLYTFTRGIGELIKNAGATKKQIHQLWLGMYPEHTVEDYEEFVRGLSDMAQYKQYQSADYLETIDLMVDDDES